MRVVLILGWSRRYFYLAKKLADQGLLDGIIVQRKHEVVTDTNCSIKSDIEKLHFSLRDKAEIAYFSNVDILGIINEIPHIIVNGMDNDVADFIIQRNPDVIITYGVGYIKSELLERFPDHSYNLHNGLIPWYKGSACHFWPFYFLEPTYVGCTFHKLAKKLDSGNIIHQVVPEMSRGDNSHDLSCKASIKMCDYLSKNIEEIVSFGFEGEPIKKSGKMFYGKDFRIEHLKVVYELYENKIVDLFLDGDIGPDIPNLIEFNKKVNKEAEMISNDVIVGEKCTLKNTEYDKRYGGVLSQYTKWMNDPEVTRFLYSRTEPLDEESLLMYVNNVKLSDSTYMFGIYENDKNTYIGNIKIGPIHRVFGFAEIGYMIGEKSFWGKGYGTEAIKLICKFGFETLNLHRLTSGCNELNIGSNNVLINNGFRLEGVLRGHELMESIGYTNKNIYGLLKEEYLAA